MVAINRIVLAGAPNMIGVDRELFKGGPRPRQGKNLNSVWVGHYRTSAGGKVVFAARAQGPLLAPSGLAAEPGGECQSRPRQGPSWVESGIMKGRARV